MQHSMSSLHISALDLVVRDLDPEKAQKHKNTINKKFIFTEYLR